MQACLYSTLAYSQLGQPLTSPARDHLTVSNHVLGKTNIWHARLTLSAPSSGDSTILSCMCWHITLSHACEVEPNLSLSSLLIVTIQLSLWSATSPAHHAVYFTWPIDVCWHAVAVDRCMPCPLHLLNCNISPKVALNSVCFICFQ